MNIFARRESAVALALGLTVLVVGILNPLFLKAGNLQDILVQVVPAAIIGCGMTFVILTGEIDISVGSLFGLLGAILGLLASPDHAHLPVPLVIVLVMAMGAAVGFINGVLVTIARVPSIIVTLGMLTALRGATIILLGGEWITSIPRGLRYIGTESVLGLRICVWCALAVIVAAALLARQTPLGRRIYAVGSNAHAAFLTGLSATRVKLIVFTLTGLLVGIAAVVSVPQLSTIESNVGAGLELLVVTAVVVGGTSISGGRGTIIGTFIAVLLLGIVRPVLIFLKLGEQATYWERAIQGAFILAAVLADHFGQRRRPAEAAA